MSIFFVIAGVLSLILAALASFGIVKLPKYLVYGTWIIGALLIFFPVIQGFFIRATADSGSTVQMNQCGCVVGTNVNLRRRTLLPGVSVKAGTTSCANALSRIASDGRYYISGCA